MGPNVRYLFEKITLYRLQNRSRMARQVLHLIEHGLLEENVAAAYMLHLQPLIDEAERFPNMLERPPEREEIYPDAPPPLIVGACAEDKDVPIGLLPSNAVHALFGGTTGSGKTVGIRRLLQAIDKHNQMHSKKIVVICLDRRGDYADLATMFRSGWVHFSVHEGLRIGLQSPLRMPARVWINHVATIFAARAGLVASWVTVANMMRWAVDVMNARGGKLTLFPDFQLLRDLAERLPQTVFATKGLYLESLLQMLYGVTLAMGNLFSTFNGLDVERDLISRGRSAVLSMPNLEPPWLSHFVVDLIVSQVLMGRIHRAHRVDELEVMLILDEADDDVSRSAEAAFPQGYMSPLARVLRQGREYGIGVVLGVGSLGPVSEHILNSATYHFLFRMSDAHCRIAAARTLQLPRGGDAIIPTLPPGRCLSRTPAWPHAVLTDIEYVPPCRDARPEYESNAHVPSKPLDEMPDVLRAIEKLAAEHRTARQRQNRLKHKSVRREARTLLELAARRPYWPVARLYDLVDPLSPTVQKSVREQLVDGDYAEIVDVRVGRKTLALIELKEAGWRLLEQPPAPLRGRGKLAHKTFSNWIATVGEKRNHDARCEWTIPGTTHAVDAAWKVDGRWRVFEVVITCESNLESHIRAALLTPGVPVESVTIVAPQKAALDALSKQVASFPDYESYKEHVHFEPVERFEKELWSR